MSSFTIMGCDPGFESFGWSILAMTNTDPKPILTVLGMGVIVTAKATKKRRTSESDDKQRRTREITRALFELVEIHKPVGISTESQSFGFRNANTMLTMGLGFGAMYALAEVCGLPVEETSPTDLKMKLTNDPTASKLAVSAALDARFGGDLRGRFLAGVPEGKVEHPYDALAAAVMGMSTPLAQTAAKIKFGRLIL